jgi:hypothetical protein
MHRTFVQSLVAAALGAAVATPAAAEPPTKYSFRGETAWAEFSSSSGCEDKDTFTYVAAVDSLTKQGASQEALSWVVVSITQYDCQGNYLYDIFGYRELEAADFVVRGGGRSATLAATVDAYIYATDSPVQLELDLSWSAPGIATQGHSASHFHSPDYSFNSSSNGRFRSATATGTVSAEATNYIPEPSDRAAVGTDAYGEIFHAGH